MARVYLSRADVTEVEERYVVDALRSGWIAPLGPAVDAFEAEVAERVGVRHAVALASGTAALHLALLSVGARPRTAVLCPTLTFAASANAIRYTGARPVFVDSNAEDGNVDAQLLLDAADRLRADGTVVSAAMSVDLFGRCADYELLVPGLAARGIPLIEDAAEALGASLRGRSAGSFGRAGALSFNGNKVMTTSGGGMLLSDDAELAGHARYLSTQARQPVPWYEHTNIGYNYRLSNILAALGRGQLARLDDMIGQRRRIRQRYRDAVAALPGVRLIDPMGGSSRQDPDRSDNCWLTTIELDPALVTITPGELIAKFAAEDIETRHLWKPMHQQPVFANEGAFLTGAAAQLFERGLTLPSGSSMSDGDLEQVIRALVNAIGA